MTQIEKKPEQKQQQTEKKQEQKKVDLKVYADFVSLKFLKLGGSKLKLEAEDRLKELEKEVKSCSGAKAKKSVTAHIGNEIIKLVEDCPIPEEYLKIIKENKAEKHYIA